ncbi:MAG: MucB/RseB C-terminal domain-containing protein [Polaromonas sp.]|nr:MucB/RseB C-terminal domain-containing protein [Polaromonas sp.]
MILTTLRAAVLALFACFFALRALAQPPVQAPLPAPAASTAAATAAETQSLHDWLREMHAAAKNRSYAGTFVVSSGGAMSSAKIWHVCEGSQQIERIETLSGAPRSTFRHNDQLITFLPEHKVARSEQRQSPSLFLDGFDSADSRIADFYKFKRGGTERVAGVQADVSLLLPRDALRFGYRVWTERKNGLVVKLQTLDADGRVLVQAAFSELQLDAPIKMDKLLLMMNQREGYRLEKPVLLKTTADAQGWTLSVPVAGFKSVSCYKRPASAASAAGAASAAAPGEAPLQWIFSDGLASVSIFLDLLDPGSELQEASFSMGATQALTRQLDAYRITIIGEVPMATLQLFANGVAHKK